MNLLPIGTEVVIKANARGHNASIYSSTSDTLTIIKGYSQRSDYPYIVDQSLQSWTESAFSVIKKPEQIQDLKQLKVFESMYTEHFGHVLRLPTGYVFSNQVTFIPSTINTL